jgi:hypothetical protein
MDAEALRRLPPVAQALADAREQARRYSEAMQRQRGEELKLRSYAVVAVDLERLVCEEVASA